LLLLRRFLQSIIRQEENYSKHELSMILKHELIHYKRRDLWYKLLVLAATALHWFNPIVRLMAKAINTQCELSCDSLVIQYTNLEWKKQYCETIIKSAKKQMKFTTAISSYFGSVK